MLPEVVVARRANKHILNLQVFNAAANVRVVRSQTAVLEVHTKDLFPKRLPLNGCLQFYWLSVHKMLTKKIHLRPYISHHPSNRTSQHFWKAKIAIFPILWARSRGKGKEVHTSV